MLRQKAISIAALSLLYSSFYSINLSTAAEFDCGEADLGKIKIGEELFSTRMKNICSRDSKGYLIDTKAFAERFADLAELPFLLRRRTNAGGSDKDPDYLYYVKSFDMPFGPSDTYDDEMICHRRKLRLLRTQANTYVVKALKSNPNVKVYREVGETLVPISQYEVSLLEDFFEGKPYRIACVFNKEGGNKKKGGEEASGGFNSKAKVRVGKTPEDLFKSTKDSGYFGFDFKDDNVKNQKSFGIDGTVGLTFAADGSEPSNYALDEVDQRSQDPGISWWSYYGFFVQAKHYDQSPDSNAKPDMSYIAPGFVYNLQEVGPRANYAYSMQLDAKPIFDEKNGSTLYSAGVSIAPNFDAGDFYFPNFPIRVFKSPFLVTPLINFVSRYTWIDDAGKNPEFIGRQDYLSLGFDSSLEVSLVEVSDMLSGFSFNVGFAYRSNSNGVADVERFLSGIKYEPTSKNYAVKLEYVDGPDLNILQDEELLKFTLGVRY